MGVAVGRAACCRNLADEQKLMFQRRKCRNADGTFWCAVWRRGKSISNIGWFLVIMSVLLLFIAAGARHTARHSFGPYFNKF